MTKQITAAERRETFSKGLKPVPPQSTMLPDRLSGESTEASIAIPTEASQASSLPQSARAPLKCQWELLSAIVKELLPVINNHYAAIGLNGRPFDPDWDGLFALERAGRLLIWTARTERGAIAGYAVCSGGADLFSCRIPVCNVESIWLDPAWREGWRGVKFVRGLVNAVHRLGKSKVIRVFSASTFPGIELVFKRVGFKYAGSMFEL